jgi:hypothetical protein
MNKAISIKLRERILPIYREMFEQNNFDNICTFSIQWGEDFPIEKNKGLLFVGKAVNGWVTDDKNVDDLFDKDNADRIFERKDQMKWVNELSGNTKGYNTNKSAFWRVISLVTNTYHPEKWYSHIAWTNLYKVAPFDGGNPNGRLQNQQKKHCINLLQSEIDTLSPAYVIMLTSGWEWPFIEDFKRRNDFKIIAERKWKKYKTSLVKIGKVKYIISHHPQGKNELEHKKAIIELIEMDK